MRPSGPGWIRPAVICACALLLCLTLLVLLLDRGRPAKGARPKAARPLLVETLAVRKDVIKAEVRATGILEAVRDVTLYAETHGQVAARPFDEDQPVRKGDIILRLDDTYKKTAVASAQAALDEARAVAKLRRSQSRRARKLERARVVSSDELERQLSQEAVAEAALRVAEQRLREAREDLDKTLIRSPIDGSIVELPFEVFEFVQTGQPVARIIDSRELKLVVEVADRERVALRGNAKVKIRTDALPGREFTGKVVRLGQAAAGTAKKFPVEIRLDNSDGTLLPGMVAEASLPLASEREGIVLAKELVAESFGQPYVYVAQEEGSSWRARQKAVAIEQIPFLPTHVEIVAGLEEGELVITTSMRELREGSAIRLRSPSGTR